MGDGLAACACLPPAMPAGVPPSAITSDAYVQTALLQQEASAGPSLSCRKMQATRELAKPVDLVTAVAQLRRASMGAAVSALKAT